MAWTLLGQELGQGSENGPVWPGGMWPGDLPAQHHGLLPQHRISALLEAGPQASSPGQPS